MKFIHVRWLVLVLGALPLVSPADETAPKDQALIVVRLPATASLRIGNTATSQTGAERRFLTPPLEKGKTYAYELTAQWKEAGLAKKTVRRVTVTAGKRALVDFTKTEPVGKSDGPAPVAPPPGIVQAPPPTPKPAPAVTPEAATAKSRTFLFTYDATVKDVPPGKTVHIWIPLAQAGPDQDVQLVSTQVPKTAKTSFGTEKEYGNKMFHVVTKAPDEGAIPVKVVFRVTRREVITRADRGAIKPGPEEKIARFLEADARVPVGGKPLQLLKDKKVPADPYAAAKMLYDVVNHHMTYKKTGTGWGQGDAVWACDSKYGNCTDFHSLFISLARAEKIPSKFVMGFAIPPQRGSGTVGGYHCWAWFLRAGKGSIPVDISEASLNPSRQAYYFGNLTEDRVQFTTGRDITLVPAQSGGPLNFFIYPYVEVDGQPYPADRVERKFRYEDVGK